MKLMETKKETRSSKNLSLVDDMAYNEWPLIIVVEIKE